ncbi:glycosyl transferase [Bacteroidia bacterium]|nr:glycosyl transferase [Bacteroidia bacterium]GHV40676.1 glycosyl transferase [Bacteroidia bacterium]
MPEITVLMPVKNGWKYIREAIDSVLLQSFKDFEFIIIDNGSTDRTVSIIKSYGDPRIHLLEQKSDFIKALNKGLSLAKGKYIARMDADDIMHSERLRIQHKRMEYNPDIAVCSTWAKSFKDDGSLHPPFQFGNGYIEHATLQLLRGNILVHPSVMMRKMFLDEHKLKYRNYPQTESYKLWFEIVKCGGRLYVEPQYLLNFRISDTQVSFIKKESISEQTIVIKKEILSYLLENIDNNKILLKLYKAMVELEKEETITPNDTFQFFWGVLNKKLELIADNNLKFSQI